MKRKRITLEKARNISIELVLQKMNYTPSKTIGFDIWYSSPLHDEKTPSFKINTKINKWYDHGLQKGGNTIDFVAIKFNYSISEVLKFLEKYSDRSVFSFQEQKNIALIFTETESKIKINKVTEIQHFALKKYLENRKIYNYENESNLREVHYEVNGKKYFGIGFKNNTEGYEIRSKYAKICIGKKDVTHLVKGYKNKLRIFEGFFDYLSFINKFKSDSDFLILNSITLINRCDEILSKYDEIELFLDNDAAGNEQTKLTLEKFNNATDCRAFYKDFKDLNEWLLNTTF
ncbi:toprim domain-containing protein [Flavobacterium okayamense]|uniref:Transposase n=1 Tax=Flavobacterium okayamense TaxID=2830782 RepID=A0ABN6I3H2_9FLAO|nr:toprim domain-containing protein [Flavobacterium okayamense]BCY28973.1 transposase [Flavobacterium okayamense]